MTFALEEPPLPCWLAISGSVGEDVVAVAVRDRGEGTPSSGSTPGEGSTFRFTLPTDASDKLLEHHDP